METTKNQKPHKPATENIQVFLRMRPPNKKEIENEEADIWAVGKNYVKLNSEKFNNLLKRRKIHSVPYTKTCFFNGCFDTRSTNHAIYHETLQTLVEGSLNGINGTLFLYGQTGAGKTYTMMGDYSEEITKATARGNHTPVRCAGRNTITPRSRTPISNPRGSIPNGASTTSRQTKPPQGKNEGALILSLKDLFDKISKSKNTTKEYFIRCSYFEIYNDSIYDLLTSVERFAEPLTIAEDTREFFIKGLTEYDIISLDDAIEKLHAGERSRHYAITAMNHHSSRSHTIFRVKVQSIQKELDRSMDASEDNVNSIITEAVLNFVDLAGSEKVSNHNNLPEVFKDNNNALIKVKEDRVKEGKSINKSLFFLTQVISMKGEGKTEHIPYRNSPLTKILKSSLGGNSRTLIVLCATPMHSQYEQTLGTIRFGMSAKKIENTICANVTAHNSAEAYQFMINEYEVRLKEMEQLRGADQQKVEYMIKMISELQKQKDSLNERLKKANETRLMKSLIVKERKTPHQEPEPAKKEFYREQIGVIFTNAKADYITQLTNENPLPIYDPKGRFALAALRNEKEKTKLLEKKVEVLKAGLVDFVKEAKLKDQCIEKLTEEYESTINEKKVLAEMAETLLEKLKFIESLEGLQTAPNEKLDLLEKLFQIHIDTIKNEKIRRQQEEKEKKLKEKIVKLTKLGQDLMSKITVDGFADCGKECFEEHKRILEEFEKDMIPPDLTRHVVPIQATPSTDSYPISGDLKEIKANIAKSVNEKPKLKDNDLVSTRQAMDGVYREIRMLDTSLTKLVKSITVPAEVQYRNAGTQVETLPSRPVLSEISHTVANSPEKPLVEPNRILSKVQTETSLISPLSPCSESVISDMENKNIGKFSTLTRQPSEVKTFELEEEEQSDDECMWFFNKEEKGSSHLKTHLAEVAKTIAKGCKFPNRSLVVHSPDFSEVNNI